MYYDESVSPTTEYIYKLQAILEDDEVADVPPIRVISAPLPPPNLNITNVANGAATLTWDASPQGGNPIDNYQIWRARDGGDGYDVIGTVSNDSSSTFSFTANGMAADSWYYYVVQAVYKGRESGFGDTAIVYTAPASAPSAPNDLQLDTSSGDSITLTWTDTATNERYFRIERAIVTSGGAGTFNAIALVPADRLEFVDTEVTAGTTYIYRLVAENAAGRSPASGTATAIAPEGSLPGRFGPISPVNYDSGPVVLGVDVSDRYPDGVRKAMIRRSGYSYYANMVLAQQLIDQGGYSDSLSAVTATDGKHGQFHLYKPAGWFSGGEFLGTLTFNALDQNDIHAKFQQAKQAADLGYINTMVTDLREVAGVGGEMAMAVIPGPTEIIVAKVIGKAVAKLAPLAISAAHQGGKWVYRKAGKILTGADEIAASTKLRNAVIDELKVGYENIKWSNHRNWHVVMKPKVTADEWKKIVKETGAKNKADAKYLPGTDVELLERYVWQSGTPVTTGKNWKVMEFDHIIGASAGKEVRWMR